MAAPQKATRCWTFYGGVPEAERATAAGALTHFLVSQKLDSVLDPLVVNGVTWNLAMPAFAEVLKDERIEDLLTYIRHEWGHSAPAVKPEPVQQVREATADHEDSWIGTELLKVP